MGSLAVTGKVKTFNADATNAEKAARVFVRRGGVSGESRGRTDYRFATTSIS